ncbi:LITAF-like zinc ribbon domain-containing protein [Gilbertella persicaria]|uniref:LITAF-like zinc ribbon domain-containing protein n=1 Tax=Gilbertella persicaria TaxID=101096 RepID=UPI00221F3CC5|nr:LITAF-like zinc ribbon domain-containing protein [Gilbertella persicaria]KAI8059951.1 LITAF-like zinc ribbon domain-containing protein [Gilbertella persicaria]
MYKLTLSNSTLSFHKKITSSLNECKKPKETDHTIVSSDNPNPFVETRSTPILYAIPSSSSSSVQIKPKDSLSLYSAHSFPHGSTRNHTFQFDTPEPYPPRKPATPLSFLKKHTFIQYNRRSSTTSVSLKSAKRSWRQMKWMPKQTLPDFETKAFCQGCEKYIQTRLRYQNGSMVWLMSFILLLCTVFLFWVPFYVKYFKDVAHYCPGCGRRLGVSRPL